MKKSIDFFIFLSNFLISSLLTKTFNELLKKEELGLRPNPFQLENIYDGNYLLTRVDVNETWHLDSEKDVLAWIRAVGEKAFLKQSTSDVIADYIDIQKAWKAVVKSTDIDDLLDEDQKSELTLFFEKTIEALKNENNVVE